MTTWREEIVLAMSRRDETLDDVIASTLTEAEMVRPFDNDFGGDEAVPFTLWTTRYVYFPLVYDGLHRVESLPRDPCDERSMKG